jgi:threonine aldolase
MRAVTVGDRRMTSVRLGPSHRDAKRATSLYAAETPQMTDEELAALRCASPRAVTHHHPRSVDAIMRELAATGAPFGLAAFEARIARELGKSAAAYFPTGTMAQQIALRVWCDRARNINVAFHPTSHLELHEHKAYAMLHGLRALHVGTSTRLMTLADIRAITDPLGAFLIELPQREIGALLPRWNDLVLMTDSARRTGAKIHLDGTRLWQAAPYYGRSHAEIAELFDSAYVSFDTGLDAITGGVLVGDADFIAEARVWQQRHGCCLPSLPILALAAERGFDRHIGKMAAYRDRARELGDAFAKIDGVVPNTPQTSTFHVFLRGDRERLEARAHAYARETGTFVFGRLASTVVPGIQKWEFVTGEATMALEIDEILDAVRAIMGLPHRELARQSKVRSSRSKRAPSKRSALAVGLD